MVLRYRPTKSSSWGHSAGRKKPSVFRELVNQFENAVVNESTFKNACIVISPNFGEPEPK